MNDEQKFIIEQLRLGWRRWEIMNALADKFSKTLEHHVDWFKQALEATSEQNEDIIAAQRIMLHNIIKNSTLMHISEGDPRHATIIMKAMAELNELSADGKDSGTININILPPSEE